MHTLHLLASLVALLSQSASSRPEPASDGSWPQFMGPHRTGQIDLEGLTFDWPPEGPPVLWGVDVGPGYGGASVYGDQVFLLDREPGEADVLRVFELATGETVWDVAYEAPGRLSFAGSRSVPTVTKEHVITCGGFGHVLCFDRESGDELWMIQLEEDYGGILPGYGWSCSPLLVGNLVVLSALGEDVGLVAIDRFSGEEAWVTKPFGTSHSTPVLLDLLGEEQIVFVHSPPGTGSLDTAGTLTISSFRPEDGELLWETNIVGSTYPIPGPVQVGTDQLFVTGGYAGGSTLIELTQKDGQYGFKVLFRIERGAQVHNPILHGDALFFLANENANDPRNRRSEGGLVCLGLDGKERWRTGDEPYFGRGNAILAGRHLLIQDGFNGTLRVVRATNEGYDEVASANVFGIDDSRDHRMWSPMALAGSKLLMRSQERLICVQL